MKDCSSIQLLFKQHSFHVLSSFHLGKISFIIHSFIHSGHFYSATSSPLPLRDASDFSTDTVSEFHAEAHRQLVKDVKNSQGPYVTARAGVEHTTLRLNVFDSTKAPSRPTT